LLRRADWMRQLTKEQWQLIASKLLHERHLRRLTDTLMLRTQDTETSKLGTTRSPYRGSDQLTHFTLTLGWCGEQRKAC
jgi:meiotically up-regulated gene 157 (Mug157) protein